MSDCTDCGACCWSARDDWIEVFGADRARMDAPTRALTVEREGRTFMRFAQGRCTALHLEGSKQRCSIYPMRPDACRWLQPGSSTCASLIELRRANSSTGSD